MAQLEYIQHYVQSILPILRLDQWEIRIADWTPAPEGSEEALEDEEDSKSKDLLAFIVVEDESRGASIKLYPKFYTEPPVVQQQCLTHELCHAIVAQYSIDVAPLLDLIRDKQARKVVEGVLNRREEILVDEIAWMILPRLPAYSPPS